MSISFAVDNHIETYQDLDCSHEFILAALKAYLRAGYLNNVFAQVGDYKINLETFLSDDDDDSDHYLARITVESTFLSFSAHYLIQTDEDFKVIAIEELDDVEFTSELEECECMYHQDISQAKLFTAFLEFSE